jgi:predicted nucleic acid-binding Zn ribbon protein
MLRKAKYPERIDKVLVRTLKGLKIDRRIKEETTLLNWSKVVGDRIASYANPLRVRDSILFVRVENASWRNELVFLKGKIIKELNQSVKANVIKDIVFVN